MCIYTNMLLMCISILFMCFLKTLMSVLECLNTCLIFSIHVINVQFYWRINMQKRFILVDINEHINKFINVHLMCNRLLMGHLSFY